MNTKTMVQELTGYAGLKLRGVSLSIDLVSKCCLACPSCGAGIYRNSRPQATMSIPVFEQVLDKILAVHKIRYCMFFNHSDSLLHPKLDEAIGLCNQRGIPTCVGTVLQQVKCDLAKVIEARPTEFRWGFSGFKHYGRNQRGATVERLMQNLEILDKLPKHPETRWTMFFHSYRDNFDEAEEVKELALKHRFEYIMIPAIFQGLEKIVRKNYSQQDLDIIQYMWETPEQMLQRVKKSDYCPLIRKWINLDAQGNAYLCNNLYPDEFGVGNIFVDSVEEIQRKMAAHGFCGDCKKAGTNVMHQCYENPIYEEKPVVAGYKRFKWLEGWNK